MRTILLIALAMFAQAGWSQVSINTINGHSQVLLPGGGIIDGTFSRQCNNCSLDSRVLAKLRSGEVKAHEIDVMHFDANGVIVGAGYVSWSPHSILPNNLYFVRIDRNGYFGTHEGAVHICKELIGASCSFKDIARATSELFGGEMTWDDIYDADVLFLPTALP